MSKAFDFDRQNKVGVAGEKFFAECYSPWHPRKSPDWDWDFDTDKGKVEVKSDTYPMANTPNFFMEHYGDTKNWKLGGPWRAAAGKIENFVYLFLSDRTFFWFEPKPLTEFLNEYVEKYNPRVMEIPNKNWTTLGYKIPRTAVEHLYVEEKF